MDSERKISSQYEIVTYRKRPARNFLKAKSTPCVVLSPDEMNRHLNTVVVAPLVEGVQDSPSRITIHFERKTYSLVLDQISTVERDRLGSRIKRLTGNEIKAVKSALHEIYVL